MRKSTILIVAVVYFASILFIIFYGLQFGVGSGPVYVREVWFVEDERFGMVGGIKTVNIHENDIIRNEEGHIVIELNWAFYPSYATVTRMNFSHNAPPITDGDYTRDRISFENSGESPVRIVFYTMWNAMITIQATGGLMPMDQVAFNFLW